MLVAASPLAININRFDFNHINEAGVRNTCTNVTLVKKSSQYNWFWRSHGTKTTDWTMLAPASFSREYKNFDQQMQTVKNETTVKNLVFEGFLQTSIPPLISIFYAKDVVQFFCPSNKNFRSGTLRCFRKFRVWKNFMHKKGISLVSVDFFCLTVPQKFVGEPFCVSKKNSGIENFHA